MVERQAEIKQLMKDKEQSLKRMGSRRSQFKSNTRVELAMRPYETMATYTTFVKKGKLVIFIEHDKENLISFKKTINKFNFKGTFKYYRSTQEAIDFLKTVVKPNDKRATADLIFCQYKMPEVNGLQLIE